MRRLRVGLVGAGLVGQAAHAFFLWEDRERFDLVALADASAEVRAAVGDRYGIPERHAALEPLLSLGLDAVVCATPDPSHPAITIAALNAGLHVLCEKPLALTTAACDEMITARDRSQRVLQVAYMKCYDPAVERMLELLPERIEDVRYVSVEVNDPDHEPFVAHLPMRFCSDVPDALITAGRRLWAAQLAESAGGKPDEAGARALAGGYLSAMVHDVAVLHGIVARYGVELPEQAARGTIIDEGRGAQLGVFLPGGGYASLVHLNLPGVNDYTERVTVYCTDRILELVFPAPYLRHHPTRLTLRRNDGALGLTTTEIRASYEEAFRNELRAFHAAICDGAAVRTPPELARRDVALLVSAYHRAMER